MTEHMDYQNFVRGKIAMAKFSGFDVNDSEISPILKPHQRDIVKWAVRGGCRAIFAAFGLGKSVMQIETLRLIHAHAGGKVLVICPLGRRGQGSELNPGYFMDSTYYLKSMEQKVNSPKLFDFDAVE